MLDNTLAAIEWHHWFVTAVSTLASCAVVKYAPNLPRFYGHSGISSAIQASHVRPTPRVGGIAVFAALVASVAVSPPALTLPYAGFLLAASTLFLAGLVEDLGFGVSPTRRLLAAIAASMAVILLFQTWLPRLGIPGLDWIVAYPLFGIPFTLLATAGVANGFNLIDGVNGLAALTAIGASVALSLIALAGGAADLSVLCLMLAAATLGFFLLNFPFGLVFLGDAGAYTLGFVLAWFGIAVLTTSPDASPWAILLCVFWPVADTLLAIYRRIRRKAATTAPDRLHVHQMVMRSLELCLLGRRRRNIANPLSTVVLAPFVLAPPTTAVFVWNDNRLAFFVTVVYAILFVAGYMLAPRLARRLRTRLAPAQPVSA